MEKEPHEVEFQHGRTHGVFESVGAATAGKFMSPPNVNIKDVKLLLKAGGATVVDLHSLRKVAEVDLKMSIVVGDEELEKKGRKSIMEGAKTVSVAWLSDCIITGSCPPANAQMFETINMDLTVFR